MDGAKIQLSAAEMALVCDAEVILTKNRIMEKAKVLFEDLQARMQEAPFGSAEFLKTGPKISRGENYGGLPYLVLDYPRLFGQQDVFAIRTFFWWGNFFSSTLQLSGRWHQQLAPALGAAFKDFSERGYFVQVGHDPWAHHFGADNYRPVAQFGPDGFAAHLQQRTQIKIAARWPLNSWPGAANNLWESWRFLLGLCSA